jgi:beta-mannosidase
MQIKQLVIAFLLLALLPLMACNETTASVSKDSAAVQIIPLKSDWQFRQVGKEEWHPATVPGTVHTDLLNNKLIKDPFYRTNEKDLQWIENEDWEYKTTITVGEALLKRQHIELCFKGLDTYATVYVNEQLLLTANNMFRQWKADAKPLLKKGENEIRIRFKSPITATKEQYDNLGYRLPASNDQGKEKVSIFARKAPYHYGWDWAPRYVTSGVWRNIQMEAWDSYRITDFHIRQNEVTAEKAKLTAVFEIETEDNFAGLEVEVFGHKRKVVSGTTSIDFEIKRPQLWWTNGLGDQNLYLFFGELYYKGKMIDSKTLNVGLRSLKLVQEKDSIGTSFYFVLNGEPVFMKGANYIPNDNFVTRVPKEKYDHVIKSAKDANMNMLRVWGGGIYENDYFYELCDQNGILVWQDFMFACSMYPGDQEFLKNVEIEAVENIKRLRTHACIALWCGNNEVNVAWNNWGWQKELDINTADSTTIYNDYVTLFENLLPGMVELYDPQRSYIASSPISNWGTAENFNHGDMHYWGVWHGEEPFKNFKTNVPRFMSEFGFQSFPEYKTIRAFAEEEDMAMESEVMKWHQKSYKGNRLIGEHLKKEFGRIDDFKSFLYVNQLVQAEGMKIAFESHRKNKGHCWGTLYWQLNDCWPGPSWSGMDYYGRWKAMHYYIKRLFAEVLVIAEKEKGELVVHVVSDRSTAIAGNLEMKLVDFNGQLIWEKTEEITVPKNGVVEAYRSGLNKFWKGKYNKDAVLQIKFTEGGNTLSETYFYKEFPKTLNLEKPNIQLVSKELTSGFEVKVTTDKLAKNVCLTTEIEGTFSDNYFDLLPGETKIIRFFPRDKNDFSLEEFGVKVVSLWEVFRK